MRIAINALTITPGISVSAQVYLTNLIEALQENDPANEYLLVAGEWNSELFPLLGKNFKMVVVPWQAGRLLRVLMEQVSLPSILKRERVDIFYAAQGNTLPLHLSCPAILNIHYMQNFTFPDTLPRLKRMYLSGMMRHAVEKAACVICPSESLKTEILRHLQVSPDKIRVVAHGISRVFLEDTDGSSQEVQAKLGVQKPYILTVGNALPHKNLGRLVKAYIQLKSQASIPHRLVIVGESRIRETLASELKGISSPLFEQIIFTGYIENNHLPKLYRSADLFVFPSYCESFGIPLLEAMASGTPIVTSNTQALPEVADGAAYLVNPFDPQDIARGMFRVLTEPQLREVLVHRGEIRIKYFSWDRTAQETAKVFAEVADRCCIPH